MANNTKTSTKVIVVGGGGTMGSSTALHLVRSGYIPSNITILDVYPIPSARSAGFDLNKIMSVQLRNGPDLQLSMEALDMWRGDDLFAPFFHNVGLIRCSSSSQGIANLRKIQQSRLAAGTTTTTAHGGDNVLENTTHWLDTEDDILERVPAFSPAQVKGWKGLLCDEGGWLAAADAIDAIGRFLASQGVKFISGRPGTFSKPIFSEKEEEEEEEEEERNNTCVVVGVETIDGTKHYADKVILATGAWSPTLVDLEDQCVSKAWVLAHIQLTPEEAAKYKGIPVIYDGEYGFFFEPNENGIIKICDEFPGFSNFKQHRPYGSPSPQKVSVPRSHADHPSDTYPDASELTIRRAIDRFLPDLSSSSSGQRRELLNRSMCWCADTADANLLICEHPRWKNFILATGDSGHTFKFLPNIGKHIVQLMEGTLSPDLAQAWRWRPGTGDALKSTRAAPARDLADMEGWKHGTEEEEEAKNEGK